MRLALSAMFVLYLQGLECTTMFCGDGINDLSALAAAEVSVAIGATDAAVAAAVSTPHASVAGFASAYPGFSLAMSDHV